MSPNFTSAVSANGTQMDDITMDRIINNVQMVGKHNTYKQCLTHTNLNSLQFHIFANTMYNIITLKNIYIKPPSRATLFKYVHTFLPSFLTSPHFTSNHSFSLHSLTYVFHCGLINEFSVVIQNNGE